MFVFTLSERRQSTTLFGVETSRFYSMPKLENFLNHKAKIITVITYRAKLLNADWLRQRAVFLNHDLENDLEGTFGIKSREGMIT